MDWQTIKFLMKASALLAVIFYLIVIFGYRLLADNKDDDI